MSDGIPSGLTKCTIASIASCCVNSLGTAKLSIKYKVTDFLCVVLCAMVSTALVLGGCGVTGHYEYSGPCKGFHKDQHSCLKAADNSEVIGNIGLGQSMAQVREIMGKGPELRDANQDSETWTYITEYSTQTFTSIIFKDGAQ